MFYDVGLKKQAGGQELCAKYSFFLISNMQLNSEAHIQAVKLNYFISAERSKRCLRFVSNTSSLVISQTTHNVLVVKFDIKFE